MAQKTVVTHQDDLDGGAADETVSFALDGVSYEIDLSTKNAEKLRSSLNKYTAAARRIGRAARKRSGTGAVDRQQTTAIREWARNRGLEVSNRGPISAAVVEQYHASAR